MKVRQLLIASILSLAAACAAPTQTTVISIQDLDCSSCGEEIAEGLMKEAGVEKVSWDRNKAELVVLGASDVDVLALARKHKPEGESFTLVLGAGQGSYLPFEQPKATADVQEVGKPGEDIADVATLAVPGKFTIVDFAAKWCGPCRELDAHIVEIAEKRGDIAYRKLDIVDWDSPLAMRYMKDARELPYVMVFAPDGRRVDAITGIDKARLAKALTPPGGAPLMTGSPPANPDGPATNQPAKPDSVK